MATVPPHSLSGQLNRALLILVCTFWLLGAAGAAWYVNREISESVDSSLIESANRLLDLAAHEIDEANTHQTAIDESVKSQAFAKAVDSPVMTSGAVPEVLGGDYLMYQVVDGNGRMQMRSVDAPETPLDVPRTPGFAQTDKWRVYTLRHPVQDLYIHVADPLAHRYEARNESLMLLLLPLLAILPLLAFGVRRTVNRQMMVVDRITAEIGQRSGADLTAVDASGLPDELSNLVSNVNHMLLRLQDALQTERSLSANAAHELRTPLTVAQLRLSNALNQDLPDQARTEVMSASNALTQLKRRTEKLLQLSRAESGAALSREPVSLNRVVAAVLAEFQADSEVLDRLQVHLDDDTIVMGDFDAIAIALRNLLENSMRYGGEGLVEICNVGSNVLCVRDHGPGVSPAQLQELAQRHVRFANQKAGFGLGLSIVKSIMDRQQGRLELHAPPAGQTTGFEARMVFGA